MNLEKLKEPIPYKYRVQSSKYGKSTIVSYISSRDVQDKLDEVVGAENWQSDFRLIDGKLFAGIGIKTPNGWVWKWDVGTEGNMEAEKSEASDALKRSAVQWGIGRFLYSLGIITLKAVSHNNKEYPARDDGSIIWGVDELQEYCKFVVKSGQLDRTKIKTNPTPKKEVANITTDKKTTASKAPAVEEQPKSAIQPSKAFDDHTVEDARRIKAVESFKTLDGAVVLNYIIKEKKLKYVSVTDFLNKEPIEMIVDVYQAVRGNK